MATTSEEESAFPHQMDDDSQTTSVLRSPTARLSARRAALHDMNSSTDADSVQLGWKLRRLNSAFNSAFQRAIEGVADDTDCTPLMHEYIRQAELVMRQSDKSSTTDRSWRADAEAPSIRNFLTDESDSASLQQIVDDEPTTPPDDRDEFDEEPSFGIECGQQVSVTIPDPTCSRKTRRVRATVLAIARQDATSAMDRYLVRINDDSCAANSVWRYASQLGELGEIAAECSSGYECKECNRRFNLTASFTDHLRAKHGGACYACTLCGRIRSNRPNSSSMHTAQCAIMQNWGKVPGRETAIFVGRDRTRLYEDDGGYRSRHWIDYEMPAGVSALFAVELSEMVGIDCKRCNACLASTIEWLRHRRSEHGEQQSGICDDCPFSAGNDDAILSKHCFAMHHFGGTGQHECDECGERFDKEESLQCHVATHYPAVDDMGSHSDLALPTYSCQSCDDNRYDTESALKEHLSSEHGGYQLACTRCAVCCANREQLSKHVRDAHANANDVGDSSTLVGSDRCVNAMWLDFVDRSTEWSFPEASAVFVCGTCAAPFTSARLLFDHRRGEHNEQLSRFCELCDFFSDDDTALGKHCATRHRTRRAPIVRLRFVYDCKTCGARFASTVLLLEHRRRAHKQQLSMTCDECKYDVPKKCHNVPKRPRSATRTVPCATCAIDAAICRNKRFSWHCFFKHTDRAKLYKCWHCEERYAGITRLRTHEEEHGPAKYKCRHCAKLFRRKINLYQHVKQHSGMNFECDECGRQCATSKLLRYHQWTHSVECSLQCDVCGRRFCQYQSLLRHRLLHKGDRPAECNECGKTFRSESNLHRHLWHHSGSPHWCDKCRRGFRSRATLLKHARKHVADGGSGKAARCQRCKRNYASPDRLLLHQRRVHDM